jgi:hypothetical protein
MARPSSFSSDAWSLIRQAGTRRSSSSELASRHPGPFWTARRSSSSSGIYAVIKTKKNVVAAAVTTEWLPPRFVLEDSGVRRQVAGDWQVEARCGVASALKKMASLTGMTPSGAAADASSGLAARLVVDRPILAHQKHVPVTTRGWSILRRLSWSALRSLRSRLPPQAPNLPPAG